MDPTISDGSVTDTDESPRPAGIRQVAALAGVSVSTVSRALSGHPDVSQRVRDRVAVAARDVGYEPDFVAQSLRRGATLSIGFVVGDLSNPLVAEWVSGAESTLRAAGFSTMFMDSENDPMLDAAHVRFFRGRRVDGLILSLASEREEGTFKEIPADVPVVVLDRDVPSEVGASAVLSDHALGMSQAVNHLLDLGHRKIALVTGSLDIRPGRARTEAMIAAMGRRGFADDAIVTPGAFTASHAESATGVLLDGPEPPTAIIAGGNQLLVGCLRAMRERNVSIPGQVSIVTCDETPFLEFHTPPIAAIVRNNRAIGIRAAELLLRRIAHESRAETVILPTTFVPRSSCGTPSP